MEAGRADKAWDCPEAVADGLPYKVLHNQHRGSEYNAADELSHYVLVEYPT